METRVPFERCRHFHESARTMSIHVSGDHGKVRVWLQCVVSSAMHWKNASWERGERKFVGSSDLPFLGRI